MIFLWWNKKAEISFTDSKEYESNVAYLADNGYIETLGFLPSNELVIESEVVDYRFVFYDTNPLEEPIFHLQLILAIRDHDIFCDEMKRLEYADDGLNCEYDEGWINIRKSNTEPYLRLIVERRKGVEEWTEILSKAIG